MSKRAQWCLTVSMMHAFLWIMFAMSICVVQARGEVDGTASDNPLYEQARALLDALQPYEPTGPYHMIAVREVRRELADWQTRVEREVAEQKRKIQSEIEAGKIVERWPALASAPAGLGLEEAIEQRMQYALDETRESAVRRFAPLQSSAKVEIWEIPGVKRKTHIRYNSIVRAGKRVDGTERSAEEIRIERDHYLLVYDPRKKCATLHNGYLPIESPSSVKRRQLVSREGQIIGVAIREENGQRILRVVYGDPSRPGGGMTKVLDILTGESPRLVAEYNLSNGHLNSIVRYGDFRMLKDGTVYPFQQEHIVFMSEADNPNPDVLALAGGNLAGLVHMDLSICEKNATVVREVTTSKIEKMEKLPAIDDALFDIELPAGASYVDTRGEPDVQMQLQVPIRASRLAIASQPAVEIPGGASLKQGSLSMPETIMLSDSIK